MNISILWCSKVFPHTILWSFVPNVVVITTFEQLQYSLLTLTRWHNVGTFLNNIALIDTDLYIFGQWILTFSKLLKFVSQHFIVMNLECMVIRMWKVLKQNPSKLVLRTYKDCSYVDLESCNILWILLELPVSRRFGYSNCWSLFS